jgi:single-strand DNA-binding protein
MRNVNKVFLLGNLTATPELKYTGGGTAVTNFSLATNESYKDAEGNWVEKPQFHNITAWGNQAELICKMAVKGTAMHVEGSLNYGQYDHKVAVDANGDALVIRTTEVKLREFVLTGSRVAPADDADYADDDAANVDESDLEDGGEEPEDELPF